MLYDAQRLHIYGETKRFIRERYLLDIAVSFWWGQTLLMRRAPIGHLAGSIALETARRGIPLRKWYEPEKFQDGVRIMDLIYDHLDRVFLHHIQNEGFQQDHHFPPHACDGDYPQGQLRPPRLYHY